MSAGSGLGHAEPATASHLRGSDSMRQISVVGAQVGTQAAQDSSMTDAATVDPALLGQHLDLSLDGSPRPRTGRQ
jgi:hypothetical protein